MSKILDALQDRAARKHASGIGGHDEIAKTYFHAPQKKNAKKSPKWTQMLPWLITAFVVLIAITVVLSKSSIDIKVRLLGEIPTINGHQGETGSDKGLFLIKGGRPETDMVKNAYFAGDAMTFSASGDEEVVLCNTRRAGWGNYTIELKEPVDLNKLDLKYTARGDRENEYLTLVLVDSSNRVYSMTKDLSSLLANDWRKYTINFRPLKNVLDLSSIAAIKFEFGSLTAGNYSNAVMYLKDIYLAKNKRLKWL